MFSLIQSLISSRSLVRIAQMSVSSYSQADPMPAAVLPYHIKLYLGQLAL